MSIEDFRIDNHVSGGLQITHLAYPRFRARWTTGEFPIDKVREGAFFWTDEGGSPADAIHLFAFEWEEAPPHDTMVPLMRRAVMAIENYILHGF